MGLFDKIFPPKTRRIESNSFWQLMNGYTPIFSNWSGDLFESELVRAAVNTRAQHAAKLKISFEGSAKPELISKLRKKPNEFQTWYQLLYRISVILDLQNTAFIIPILGKYGETTGLTTMLPMSYSLISYDDGQPWIRFQDFNGNYAAIELNRVGILTKFQYKSDFFGSDNEALNSTMALIDIQEKGIKEAIRNSNSYKFWGRADNFTRSSDLKKEASRFSQTNFQGDSGGGLLLFPSLYNDIHQADIKPYTPDYNTLALIQTNVFNYFGVNEKIIQNKTSVDELDSFYNGCIEPFQIQLQEVLQKMLFSDNEVSYGNKVIVESSRLQYMTTSQKVQLVSTLSNVGALYVDEIRELFNYGPLEDGRGRVIPTRGEYKDVGSLLTENPIANTDTDTENTDTEGE